MQEGVIVGHKNRLDKQMDTTFATFIQVVI
jgi:hypothetical protein